MSNYVENAEDELEVLQIDFLFNEKMSSGITYSINSIELNV